MDHEATARIIQYLEDVDRPTEAQRASGQTRETFEECRKGLARDFETTTDELERAATLGFVNEAARLAFSANIQAIRDSSERTAAFLGKHGELKEIRQEIQKIKRSSTEAVRKRLEEQVRKDNPTYDRINSVLNSFDVHAASEYIQMVLDGRKLPEIDQKTDVFGEFFPSKFKEIENFLEPLNDEDRPNWAQKVTEIRRHHAAGQGRVWLGPIDMEHIRGNQARSAANMLESWFTLKKGGAKGFDEAQLRVLLESVGFSGIEVGSKKFESKSWQVSIRTRALADRNLCPVPQIRINGEWKL